MGPSLGLTHLGWDKMAAMLQMSFSNAFSFVKMDAFLFKFHGNINVLNIWFILSPDLVTSMDYTFDLASLLIW